MEHLVQPTLVFIASHPSWAATVVFVTSFGESFALVSLLFPSTSLLIAAGTLMAAGSFPYLPILTGAIIGAVLGDTVSFWIGHRFGGGIARVWPFTRNPLGRHLGMFVDRHVIEGSIEHRVALITREESLARVEELLEGAKQYLPLLEQIETEADAAHNGEASEATSTEG
jgi:hypothetical protein